MAFKISGERSSSENSFGVMQCVRDWSYNRYSRLMRANSGPCFRRQSLPSGISRQGRCAAPSVKILDCGGSLPRRSAAKTGAQRRHRFSNVDRVSKTAWRFASRRSPNKLIAVASRSHFVSFRDLLICEHGLSSPSAPAPAACIRLKTSHSRAEFQLSLRRVWHNVVP